LNSCVYIGLKLPRSLTGTKQPEVNVVTPIEQFKLEIAKWPHKTVGMNEPKSNLVTLAEIPDFVISSLSEAMQGKVKDKLQKAKERKERLALEKEKKLREVKEEEEKVGEKRKEAPGEDPESKKIKI
jgi:hypothetical protein